MSNFQSCTQKRDDAARTHAPLAIFFYVEKITEKGTEKGTEKRSAPRKRPLFSENGIFSNSIATFRKIEFTEDLSSVRKRKERAPTSKIKIK